MTFSLAFFVINLPFFYAFSWIRMGKAFTVKTFATVSLLSLFPHFLPMCLHFDRLLAAVLGAVVLNLTPHPEPPAGPLHGDLSAGQAARWTKLKTFPNPAQRQPVAALARTWRIPAL